VEPGDTVSNPPYTVVGNPSLSKNQFFEIRITNHIAGVLSDTLWFNDVIMVSPKTDVGRIFRGNGSITLADFASVNFSYDESNGRFRRLTEPNNLATQSENRGYSISTNVSLNKFLPDSWQFSIPVGISYRKSTRTPRYSYYADDVELTSDEAAEQRATNLSRSYTVGFSKAGSKNWFIKNTLDRLSLNYSRSQAHNRSTLKTDTSMTETYRGSYILDPKFDFKLLGQTFSLLPRNVSFSAQYSRNAVRSYYRDDADSAFQPSEYGFQDRKTLSPSLSVSYSPHKMINASYALTQTRDSVGTRGRFGEEVSRNQTFNASISEDLKIIRPTLSFNSSYRENHSFELRQDEDVRNVENSGKYGAEGTVDIQRLFGLLTRLRDETKDTLLTVGSPAWLAKSIEDFMSHIQSVKLSYFRQRTSNYLNVRVRPDVRYQWGLVDSIPASDIAPGSYPGRGVLDTYSANSGLNFKVITMTGGFTGRLNKTYSYGGDEVRTRSTSYPNLTVSIQRFEALPLLKNFMKTSSVSSSFNQSYEERYDFKATDTIPRLLSDSKGTSFDPLVRWSANWNKGISSNIDFSYTETKGNNYSAADTVPSLTVNRRGSLRLGYTFSAPRGLSLPLLGGIKFSTNATVNLGLNYSRTTNYYRDLQIPTNDTSTLGANVDISANFSSSITGGFNLDYSQTNDKNSVQDIRRVALNFWMNINF
jgi:hypothetical protein